MPSEFYFGVKQWQMPTAGDIEIRSEDAVGGYFDAELIDHKELLAVPIVATVDLPPGTPLEYRVMPRSSTGEELSWTPWTPTVSLVPEPGPSWAYLTCALVLAAMVRRRKRK